MYLCVCVCVGLSVYVFVCVLVFIGLSVCVCVRGAIYDNKEDFEIFLTTKGKIHPPLLTRQTQNELGPLQHTATQ